MGESQGMCVAQHMHVVRRICAGVLQSRGCSVCAGVGRGLLCMWVHGQPGLCGGQMCQE